MKGIIIKSTGNWYTVFSEDEQKFKCRIRGRLRIDDYKSTNPIAVGDKVTFELETDKITGVINNIEERKNCIIRRATNLSKQSHIIATNISQAFLFVTFAFPKTSFGFIDRFLATCEAYRIPVQIIFNKADIFENDDELKKELEHEINIYENINYKCHSISSIKMKKSDKEKMISLLKNNTTLICGHSGVGKSSFLNAIEPSLNLKTEKISKTHLKGIHTTTFAEMHLLSFGGFVIDTPGIKEFGLIKMERNEMYHFFKEIFAKASKCKYNTCLHINEPKCAVIEATQKGEIALSRYHSYLSIMNGKEVVKEYDN
ncbi:MAG: ribosome small subunit-dependent GTPase A [Bacteroidota bacterium]